MIIVMIKVEKLIVKIREKNRDQHESNPCINFSPDIVDRCANCLS